MEQIYYTQCPMGYGLGASNGFQVKRITPGYPLSSDFRHLGLRAFPGGARTLAPPTLRYRRSDGVAEVAWLTPRPFEYETERGLWGRPGGHFAHGVRLTDTEESALSYWLAGLYGSERWIRTDPIPSRGQVPDPFELSEADLFSPPEFRAVRRLAEGIEVELLAKILTAIATVVREGRTLFLLDHQERLGPRIALLTFAFPTQMRSALTFSTFHDRPEELPGFRLHGTTSHARPNRHALLSQGIIVDLIAESTEPRLESTAWARRLAGWLVQDSDESARAWDETNQLASRVAAGWEETDLDALFAYHDESYGRGERPNDSEGWTRLGNRARWVGEKHIAASWTTTHGPAWWPEEFSTVESREALTQVLALPESWIPAERVVEWGGVVARAWADADFLEREDAMLRLLRLAPKESRASFLRSLTTRLPTAAASSLVRILRGDSSEDATLLPVEAGNVVRIYLDTGRSDRLVAILRKAVKTPGLLPSVLDALDHEASGRDGARATLANDLTQLFLNFPEARKWALRQGDHALAWLAPSLRPVLATPRNQATWRWLLEHTQPEERPAFARVFLQLAVEPVLAEDVFTWGVEHALLGLPAESRPTDPTWAGLYLDRTTSDLELIDSVFRSKTENAPVREWIRSAVARNELTEQQQSRLDRLQVLVRALKSKQAASIAMCELAEIPRQDRPRLLGMILNHTRDEPGRVLELVGQTWPDLLAGEQNGRASAAQQLARWPGLADLVPYPAQWLDRLRWILERLNQAEDFGPEGVASEVVAATTQLPGNQGKVWGIRQWIFDQDPTWRALKKDLKTALDCVPAVEAPSVVNQWDQQIDKGVNSARFWELVLNACDGPRLASVVASRADELRTLDNLSWWAGKEVGSTNPEIREAFTLLAPMGPLPEDRLGPIQNWLRSTKVARPRSELVPVDTRPVVSGMRLSPKAEARWRCLESITTLYREGLDSRGRAWAVFNWRTSVPLVQLSRPEQAQFVAWMVRAIDSAGDFQLGPVAKWLHDSGFDQVATLDRWPEFTGANEGGDSEVATRAELVQALKRELLTLQHEARERAASVQARPVQREREIE